MTTSFHIRKDMPKPRSSDIVTLSPNKILVSNNGSVVETGILNVYDSNASNYVSIRHNISNGFVSSSFGELILSAGDGGAYTSTVRVNSKLITSDYIYDNGLGYFFSNNRCAFRSTTPLQWADSNVFGTIDLGIGRSATGVLQVHNGTVGNYRDLYSRSVRFYNSSGTAYTVATNSGMQSSSGDLCLLNPAGYGIKISTDIPGGSGPLIRPNAGSQLHLHGSPNANDGQCMYVKWNGGRTDIGGVSGGFRGLFDAGITIGDNSTVINKVKTGIATLDFPSIAPNGHQELTVAVTGAAVGDCVFLAIPSTIESGLIANGYVSAANTVTVRLANVSTISIEPASASWRATIMNL